MIRYLRYLSVRQLKQQFHRLRLTTSFLFPRLIYIEPTNKCTLECYMCPSRVGYREKGFMDLELYKKIIDDLRIDCLKVPSRVPTNQTIYLIGQGEPLLSDNIFEMIKYTKEAGFHVGFSTNGTVLTNEITKKLISTGLDKIDFSIYSSTHENYKKIYGYDLFEKVISNILNFLYVARNSSIYTEVHVLESKRTESEQAGLNYLLSQLPFDYVRTLKIENFHGIFNELGLHEEIEFIEKRGHTNIFLQWLWDWAKSDTTTRVGPCPWASTMIHWNGNVNPCVADYRDRYIVGNVRNESIISIWNNERYREFRGAILTNNYDKIDGMVFCNGCSYAEWVRLPLLQNMLQYLYVRPFNVIRREMKKMLMLKKVPKKNKYLFLEKHFPIGLENGWAEKFTTLGKEICCE